MVIDIVLFLLVDSQIILLLGDGHVGVHLSLLFKEFDIELHHDFVDVLSDFLDEGADNVLLLHVEFVETPDVVQQFDELVMNFPLVFRFSLLLLDLPLQDLQELRFQQHLLNRYEYLNNHLDDLADGKFETNAVRNRNLVIDAFVSVQR